MVLSLTAAWRPELTAHDSFKPKYQLQCLPSFKWELDPSLTSPSKHSAGSLDCVCAAKWEGDDKRRVDCTHCIHITSAAVLLAFLSFPVSAPWRDTARWRHQHTQICECVCAQRYWSRSVTLHISVTAGSVAARGHCPIHMCSVFFRWAYMEHRGLAC